MVEDPADFYSRNAEKQSRAMREENVSERFLDFRDDFADRIGSGKVLDAGCGPGRHTAYLRREGLDVLGVDISEGSIEYARERFGGDFRVMDIRDLEFPDDEFDGVFCSASIMFMGPGEMKDALSELRRVLQGDGVLYVNFKIGEGRKTTEKWGSTVARYYVSVEEARRMLESAGFRIEREAPPQGEEHSDFADFLCRPR